MKQIEENIINSFRLAKSDIIRLQQEVARLSAAQERLMEIIHVTDKKENDLYQRVKELKKNRPSKTKIIRISKRAKKVYVASKSGKVVHDKNCPFAKNIKPKMKIIFKSKSKAFNKGYKPCNCMKRV